MTISFPDYDPNDPNEVAHHALLPPEQRAANYFAFLNSFYHAAGRSMNDIRLNFCKIQLCDTTEPPMPDELFNLCLKYGINDQMSPEDWNAVMSYHDARRKTG